VIIDFITVLFLILIIFTDFLFYEIKNQHLLWLLIIKFFYIYFYGVISIWLMIISLSIFGILFYLFFKGCIGGGDVKLITILMLGFSVKEICNFLINMSFIGGVEVFVFIVLQKYIRKFRKKLYKIMHYKTVSKILCSVNQKLTIPVVNSCLQIEIPYGIAIGLGFLLSRF